MSHPTTIVTRVIRQADALSVSAQANATCSLAPPATVEAAADCRNTDGCVTRVDDPSATRERVPSEMVA